MNSSLRFTLEKYFSHLPCIAAVVGFLLIGFAGPGAAVGQDAADAKQPDPVGEYKLIRVDGKQVPASIVHGKATLKIRSGTFTITDEGRCRSKILITAPNGDEVIRDVNATYTQKGSELSMSWVGAGRTIGTIAEDQFKMTNEGMDFEYVRQSKPGATTPDSVLDRFLGQWTSVVPDQPDADTELTFQRVVGGKYVQESGKRADGGTALVMYMFDDVRGCYRMWSFRSSMQPGEAIGRWDDKTKSLIWTSVPGEEDKWTMTLTHRFVDDDSCEWSVTGEQRDGSATFEIAGKATRVKQAD